LCGVLKSRDNLFAKSPTLWYELFGINKPRTSGTRRWKVEPIEFKHFRERLGRTQKQIAALLGKSIKAIHSYEQGWRTIPPDVERKVLFLVSRIDGERGRDPCWKQMKCPPSRRKKCPAWEFEAGKFCWFINGTICDEQLSGAPGEKLDVCRKCKVMESLFEKELS
jgi:DNA-binding XRE family transcriptional regulator